MAVIPERQELNKLRCVIAQAHCLANMRQGDRKREKEGKLRKLYQDTSKSNCLTTVMKY